MATGEEHVIRATRWWLRETWGVRLLHVVDHQLGFQENLFPVVGSYGAVPGGVGCEYFQERFGSALALYIGELFNGGHGREGRIVAHGEVGIADKGEIFVDLVFVLYCKLNGVQRDIVIKSHDSGGFPLQRQELVHGLVGTLFGEVGGYDERGVVFEPVFLHGLDITFLPLAAGQELVGAIDHANDPMAFAQQILYCLDGAGYHVTGYIMDIRQIGYPVEKDGGDTCLAQHIEMTIILCILRNGDDQAIHPVFFHRTDDQLFPFFFVMGLSHQYGILVTAGHVLDAADGGGEECFGELGQDNADGKGLALLEENGGLIGFVVQLGGQLLDPCFGPETDAGVIVKRPRYGGGGDIKPPGDLFYGWSGGHGAFVQI